MEHMVQAVILLGALKGNDVRGSSTTQRMERSRSALRQMGQSSSSVRFWQTAHRLIFSLASRMALANSWAFSWGNPST